MGASRLRGVVKVALRGPKIKIGDPTWVTANRAVLVATETETDRDHFTRIVTEFVICILSKPQSI